MADWQYNGRTYPALPDWVKDFTYVWLEVPAGYNDNTQVIATNDLEYVAESRNYVTYQYYLRSDNCYRSILTNGQWEAQTFVGRDSIWFDFYPGNAGLVWSKTDVYGFSDRYDIEGSKYLVLEGSNPVDSETGEEIQLVPPTEPEAPPEEAIPTLDPLPLVMGYLVGCRLRANRGKVITNPDITDATFEDGVLYIRNASAVLYQDILEVT